MTKICEDDKCDNLQSAICLHCQLCLCIPHIVDHGSILLKEGDVISEEMNQLIERLNIYFQDIEKNCEEMTGKLNCWRNEQMKIIEEEYQQKNQLIQLKKQQLIDLDQQLSQRLIEQAVKPLNFIQQRQNANSDTYQIIRQTIEDITRETTQLEKDLIAFKSITETKKIPLKSESVKKNATTVELKTPKPSKVIPKRPSTGACRILLELFADISGHSDKAVEKFIVKVINR